MGQASPAFQFYPGDFALSTATFTLEEKGAYLVLLSSQWEHGSVPSDPRRLAIVLGVSPAKARSLWSVIGKKFPPDEAGVLRNDRLERVRAKQDADRDKRSRAGHVGADARWQPHANANGNRNGDRSAGANGKTMALYSPTPSLSPSGEEGTPPAAASAPDFDAFWLAYPKKFGKRDAQKAWKQTAKDRPDTTALLARLAALGKSAQWTDEGGRFIPHPATWLRRGGWDDEAGAATHGTTRIHARRGAADEPESVTVRLPKGWNPK